MMYAAATLAILVVILLPLVRALLGPTVYDRIAAMNMLGTKTILLIAAYAFLTDRHDLLDIALVYALINFIGVVAVLKLIEQGNFYTEGKTVVNNEQKMKEK
ncbi:MAG: monovalent cation/H+ antiporter complex subunit F [Cycloclasticus pugetii]|jgi:multicomponent Na+:H+ antiporter subunit F|nr:monovalent cation/H+ antiporter complex subunit F [Cycloclasticus sp.]